MKIPAELLYEYREIRAQALAECEERTRAAYAAIPRLKEIADIRTQSAFDLGKALFGAQEPERIQKETQAVIDALNKEEAEVLLHYGMPADYLKPCFRCAKCEDTGYVGKVQRSICSCMRQRVMQLKYADSRINDLERFETFRTDIFSDEKQRKATMMGRDICQQYAEAFPMARGLLLMGGTGLGKSFLLNAVAHRVSARGYGVLKMTAYGLISEVMASFKRGGELPDFLEPDLLVIDDLGAEPMISNVTREQMLAILSERQSAGKPTAMATNLSVEALQNYGERFFSRLVAPRNTFVIQLTGKDLRIEL